VYIPWCIEDLQLDIARHKPYIMLSLWLQKPTEALFDPLMY
jgi:hypothetical protein